MAKKLRYRGPFNKQHRKRAQALSNLFLKLRTPKTWSETCQKSSVWENPSTRNMVNVPKHCWNLPHSTFITFIDHCQVNRVGKKFSYWYAKSWDCLLTHWLLIKSILFLIETLSSHQFRCNYLRKKKISKFFVTFSKSRLNFESLETKYDPYRFFISENRDFEKVVR